MGFEQTQEDRYVTQREARSIDLSFGICHTLGKQWEGDWRFFSRAVAASSFSLSPYASNSTWLFSDTLGSRVNSPSLVTRRIRQPGATVEKFINACARRYRVSCTKVYICMRTPRLSFA